MVMLDSASFRAPPRLLAAPSLLVTHLTHCFSARQSTAMHRRHYQRGGDQALAAGRTLMSNAAVQRGRERHCG